MTSRKTTKWYDRKPFYIPTAIIVVIIATSPKWMELLKDKPVEPLKATTSVTAIAKDSATQNIAVDNSTTTNQNQGDVVSGNKVVSNNIREIKNQSKAADTIINNGNLSLNQQGGTVVQNTFVNPKPQPRHINKDDLDRINSNIAKSNIITLSLISPNDEGERYFNELHAALIQQGFQVSPQTIGIISRRRDERQIRFEIEKDENGARIYIYPLE